MPLTDAQLEQETRPSVGMTDDALIGSISSPENKSDEPLTWGGAAVSAAKNLPSSGGKFLHDILQPIIHPVETYESIKNLGHGVLQKVGIASGSDSEKYADAVGKFLVDRYGSVEAVKKTLATDPVGLAADVSMLLTGGGTAAARAPGAIGKIGEITSAAGRAVDPLSAVGALAKGGGAVASELIGGVGTHTGGPTIRTAFHAGKEGGEAAEAFQQSLRGATDAGDVVTEARQAVGQMRKQRGAEYQSKMAALGADKTILDFDKMDAALADIANVQTYKGQVISPSTQEIRKTIAQTIQEWKMLPASEFHTAEGLDALKRKIGDIRDATQHATPERLVADRAYQAVRGTIVEGFPEYAKTMKGYEEASKQIKEIEKTLSLNPNASIDTALRKLQSVLRNNVNTNYGQRAKLAEFLVNSGSPHLMEKLAGQALSSWIPRGLAKLAATETAAGAAGALGLGGASGGIMGALGVLPFMSPRLMGEAAYYAGKGSNVPIRPAGRTLFQGGRFGDLDKMVRDSLVKKKESDDRARK